MASGANGNGAAREQALDAGARDDEAAARDLEAKARDGAALEEALLVLRRLDDEEAVDDAAEEAEGLPSPGDKAAVSREVVRGASRMTRAEQRTQLGNAGTDRRASARDRLLSARDRADAARDRRAAALDRAGAAQVHQRQELRFEAAQDQAEIERNQQEPDG